LKTNGLFNSLPPKARILLIRLRSMGDCLLLTSPVRALKAEFPDFRISVLVEKRFAECFDGNPDFDEVLAVSGKRDAARRLLTRRFHAVVNLHGGPTSFVYSCLTWGRRIGAAHYRYAKFYHGLVPAPDSAAHTVESTLALFQYLGLRAEEAPPLRYEVHASESQRIQQTLKGRPYVVVHPSALMETKRWEPGRFAEVARAMRKRKLTIVLTCGPGEESAVAQVAEKISTTTILLGLNIPELAELIRGARLYIGNDSGPMHLAAAVGTPVVAVWGSSDSRRWRPWGIEHRVVQNHFECNPCPGYRCLVADTPLCIESVTVEQVSKAARELLNEK
jgi:predicted lipopolysaccharide heptosyltransferase III